MTNREYMKSLNDKELSYFIYSVLIPMGRRYTDSPLGIAQWLGEQYKDSDAEESRKKMVCYMEYRYE